MSMVHASRGFLNPPSEMLKSEPAIVAGIAKATLGDRYGIDWDGMVADYDLIRDKIEIVFPDFKDFNKRVRVRGGFRLDVAASDRRWKTESGKATFLVARGLDEDPLMKNPDALVLTTLRSHDQYNTTIYGLDDRYRGVFGRRDVIFMNKDDLAKRGLVDGRPGGPGGGAFRGGGGCFGRGAQEPDRGGLRHSARLGRGLLPRGQRARRAVAPRPAKRHAVLQVGAGALAGLGLKPAPGAGQAQTNRGIGPTCGVVSSPKSSATRSTKHQPQPSGGS
jgi:hypothetical protein